MAFVLTTIYRDCGNSEFAMSNSPSKLISRNETKKEFPFIHLYSVIPILSNSL